MKKWLVVVIAAMVMSSSVFAGWFSKGDSGKLIQLKGSDTILNLGQAVAEEAMKSNKGMKIAVTGGGSGTGIAALLNKTVDIAQSSRDIEKKEIEQAKTSGMNIREITVAYDGITIITSKVNPVKNLTTEQLRGIFIGEITNWKEVGGADKKIVVLSRDSSSGTHVFFKEHILRKGNSKGPEEYRKDALFLPSNQAIVSEVEKNDAAIGYVGMGYVTDTIKEVTVNGIEATVANVFAKKYPISRSLYWYVNGEPQGDVKKLVEFMLSKQGQELVKREGFVPVK
jgi:phosphate transport system substrate-binding protein